MIRQKSKKIHALEFACQAPLKFYEHCVACSRFGDNCPDLAIGKEILRGKKKLVYDGIDQGEGSIQAHIFTCTAPLHYFEKTRKSCGHKGRCREEGLLLALLSGRKELDYTQRTAIAFPSQITPGREAQPQEISVEEGTGS